MDACAQAETRRRAQEEARLMLCNRLAREGIPVASNKGECPIHGGQYCLGSWVPESESDEEGLREMR